MRIIYVGLALFDTQLKEFKEKEKAENNKADAIASENREKQVTQRVQSDKPS
jgi:hypothetical protein